MAWMIVLFSAATAILSPAQTVTTWVNFSGANGWGPYGTIIEGADGDFYGTTSTGGSHSDGTVFKVTADGALTTLHSFNGNDGFYPQGTLVDANDGNFYGTTPQGGASNYGTIFKITPAGAFTLLYSFTGGTDGRYPGALVQASNGNFYGTALGGGNNNCYGDNGCGVIYKITPQGVFSKIYQFDGDPNGQNPRWLMQGRDGNFYGTTTGFGSIGCDLNCGTVFRVTPNGGLTTLHIFNGPDGSFPSGQLLQASDGNFYGTTWEGGPLDLGTVFKITPNGVFTSLYSFCQVGNCLDGASPVSGVMQTRDGTLWGTTGEGGTFGCSTCGTIFKITTTGNLTTLLSFNGGPFGRPTGGGPTGLLQATNGNFYGLTTYGGSADFGTFYQFFTTGRTLVVATSGNGTVTSTDGLINCPGTCSHIYPDNAQVTLNANPAEGSGFLGWGGNCTGVGSCSVTMTQDQSVAATFAALYTLTVSTSGQGSVTSDDGYINCPGVCSHAYFANTQANLVAHPAPGWSLNTWGGNCGGNGPDCSILMTQNASASATFTQDSYTLTVSPSGDGSVTSTDGYINCPGTCRHTYLSLTQVTLNAAPAEGWVFGGWNGGCSGTGPCSLVMTQTLTVDAIFSQALQFVAIAPCRLVDTRNPNGTFGGPAIQGGVPRSFPIPQQTPCDIPATAEAYSLNVTLLPINGQPVGFVTVWPTGESQPNVSIMNSWDGRVKANAAMVPAGTNGAVTVDSSSTTNVVLDIDGYFVPTSGATLAFYPLPPCRVADTRRPDDPLGGPYLMADQERDFPVLDASACDIPNTAQAYSLNFTVVPRADELWVFTAWPFGQSQPGTSTLNAPTGTVVANAAIVPAGTGGEIATWASADTDLVIDINGYFAPAGEGGLSLYPTAPCRVLDTRRVGNGAPFTGQLSPPVNVVSSVCGPPSSAQAFVFNATIVPAGNPVWILTLWPNGGQLPNVSTLNAYDGAVTSNMAIVPTTDGSIDAYAAGLTQLILDISGYFAP